MLGNVGAQNRDVAIVATNAGFAVLYEENNGGFPLSTSGVKLASIDGTGNILGSRSLLGANFGGFNDLDVTRLPEGLLAFSYSATSAFMGGDSDIILRVVGQAHEQHDPVGRLRGDRRRGRRG